MNYKSTHFDPVTALQLPLSERVLDRLADILFASDEILDMIRMTPPAHADDSTKNVERSVRAVYQQINELMKGMTD